MPRKRKPKFSHSSIDKPEDDYNRVRRALVSFDEVAALPDVVRDRLVEHLVDAIRYWRAGISCGQPGLSDQKEAQHIFIADVGRGLKQAGLAATRWRKMYEGDGADIDAPESFFFRLVRRLAAAEGQALPKDLKLAAQRASQIHYGAAQAAEPTTLPRPAGVWGATLMDPPRCREELAIAYLGFPF